MTQNRSQSYRGQTQWTKKPSHVDTNPSTSRISSVREQPKQEAWNSWGETGEVNNQGACWAIPNKFEGINREEFRSIFDWDDAAAADAYIRRSRATKAQFVAEIQKLSAHIDWERRWVCNLPECAEAMTREENKRKAKGIHPKHEQSRGGSPIIIGLPGGREPGENDRAVSSLHLPLFAIPPATGWGDEGDVVPPAPTGWNVGNVAVPVATGWDDGNVDIPVVTGWDDGNVDIPVATGWDDGNVDVPVATEWDDGNVDIPVPTGWGDDNVAAPTPTGWGDDRDVTVPVSGWEDQVTRAASSSAWDGRTPQDNAPHLHNSAAFRCDEAGARRGPTRWAEVAARPAAYERAVVATANPVNQVSGWEYSTTESRVTHVASGREAAEPFASGWEVSSHNQNGMNAGWMQQPTYPNNPESYKHIKPSGWDYIPEERAPTRDVEMNQCRSVYGEPLAARDLPRNSRSGRIRNHSRGDVHQERFRIGYSRPFKHGSEKRPKKESEVHNNFNTHCRRSSQRQCRSPFANNLRVNQDSKPSLASRLERAKTTVWQAACALSNEERTSLIKNGKKPIRT
ncbi:hypothetical protein Mapa_007582 [Marchantia paleacea]|nr:hypothetical protein Mapa_007582 [Marchantia paleacea]